MDSRINVSFEILPEFDKIIWIIMDLIEVQDKAIKARDLITGEEMYKGKGKNKMIDFYDNIIKHSVSLINLYDKAYQYAINAIADMIEQDINVSRILQQVSP